MIFRTAFQCLPVGLREWRATVRTVFEMSERVMIDSHIRLPTASLYGQSPFGSPSSLRPSSTPGVAGMLEDEFAPNPFGMFSTEAFCVISDVPVPNSQLRLKAQPVYK